VSKFSRTFKAICPPGNRRFAESPRGWVLSFIVVLLLISPVFSQEEGPNLPEIRKATFADIDRRTVSDWSNKQIDELFKADDPTISLIQGGIFCNTVITNYKAANATARFQSGMAEIITQSFGKHYKSGANNAPPQYIIGITYLLTMLKEFAQPTSRAVFQQALSDPVPGFKVLGAEGLLAIRDTIRDEDWRAIVSTVDKLGVKETNPAVLSRFYRLISVNTGPRVTDSLPVMLKMLDSRLTQIDKQGKLPGPVDSEAVEWLGRIFSGINDEAQQNGITLSIARLLTHSVYAYLPLLQEAPDPKKKDKIKKLTAKKKRLELIIESTEKQLKSIATAKAPGKPRPDISGVIPEGGLERGKNMLLELDKWIGTEDAPGLLNGPPFSFKRGLDITRVVPGPAETADTE